MKDLLSEGLYARAMLYAQLKKDSEFVESFLDARDVLVKAILDGKKVLIFGNGGSAAEAQHFAAELVCQFEKKRRAIPAIALTTDSSVLTAQSNDFGFDSVFSRQIGAFCAQGDVVIGLTTSDVHNNGHSQNILNAFSEAQRKGAKRIGLFSTKTKHLINFVDVAILVPAENTALIQEAHLAIIHMFCRQIEKNL